MNGGITNRSSTRSNQKQMHLAAWWKWILAARSPWQTMLRTESERMLQIHGFALLDWVRENTDPVVPLIQARQKSFTSCHTTGTYQKYLCSLWCCGRPNHVTAAGCPLFVACVFLFALWDVGRIEQVVPQGVDLLALIMQFATVVQHKVGSLLFVQGRGNQNTTTLKPGDDDT